MSSHKIWFIKIFFFFPPVWSPISHIYLKLPYMSPSIPLMPVGVTVTWADWFMIPRATDGLVTVCEHEKDPVWVMTSPYASKAVLQLFNNGQSGGFDTPLGLFFHLSFNKSALCKIVHVAAKLVWAWNGHKGNSEFWILSSGSVWIASVYLKMLTT